MASRNGPIIPDPTRSPRKNTLPRADLPPGDCLCDYCAGKCCRYFSLPIDTPRRRADFDTLRTYLLRGSTLLYVEKKTWYLVVMTRCQYLLPDDRCRIYLGRPKICREYTTADCEYDDDWIFEQVFETPDQLREYADAMLAPRKNPPPADPDSPRGFSVPIETPVAWDDYDAIRWYLAHGSTLVYVKKRTWHLVVTVDSEDPELPDPDQVFRTPEQVWEYAEAILPPRRPKRPQPALTVITPPTS